MKTHDYWQKSVCVSLKNRHHHHHHPLVLTARISQTRYVSDLPTSQNVVQGYFIVRLSTNRESCVVGTKILGPVSIPWMGCPRHIKQVKPRRRPPVTKCSKDFGQATFEKIPDSFSVCLSLSRHPSLLYTIPGCSSRLHPVFKQSWCMHL